MAMMSKYFKQKSIRSEQRRDIRKNNKLVEKPTRPYQMYQSAKDNKRNQILNNNPHLRYWDDGEKIVNQMMMGKNR